jgi:3-oxosteroid 1-dehydrogenase
MHNGPLKGGTMSEGPGRSDAKDDRGAFVLERDMVVVGGGGAGLPAALFCRWLGNSVAILEKAETIGGTAQKAAFWYWIPNNAPMRAMGLLDRKEDFLRYIARLTAAQNFDPAGRTLGLSEWEYETCSAFYESASPAAELLNEKGALVYRHCPDVPDYFAELEPDGAATGRVLVPADAGPTMSDGGLVAVASMARVAERDGIDILVRHCVTGILQTASGEVIGVEATTPSGVVKVRARKAVIFASGGYTHSSDLRKNFLAVPAYGGCAAVTNEGDLIRLSASLGVQLRNMNYAWCCPISLEKAVKKDPTLVGMFSVAGDSMIFVDKTGRRTVNEKLSYNELAQHFFVWDGANAEYPNLVMMAIWDQRSQTHSASNEYGRLIVPDGADDAHVIEGNTLEELAANIAARLAKYAHVTSGLRLAPDFLQNLRATIERFNAFADAGKDLDFHRGERAVEVLFNGDVKDEPGRRNVTMWPIADSGPYYAALVTGGTLDTKGGPKTNTDGQILDVADRSIPGLYGVGNCVASASGRAYWAGGATLGPIIAFAYRAANKANHEAVRS